MAKIEPLHFIVFGVIIICAILLGLGIDGEVKTLLATNVIYLLAELKKLKKKGT